MAHFNWDKFVGLVGLSVLALALGLMAIGCHESPPPAAPLASACECSPRRFNAGTLNPKRVAKVCDHFCKEGV